MIEPSDIDWKKGDGLAPAIVQDAHTRQVLMLGYMNKDALKQTIKTGRVVFWSRSKERLWMKGETSGHTLKLVGLSVDCDGDAILVEAKPSGPVCHKDTVSCFGDDPGPGIGFLPALERIVDSRKDTDPNKSYVARLLARAPKKPAQKVGEEGVEVAMAAVSETKKELAAEAADLLFHLVVLLRSRGVKLGDVMKILRERHGLKRKS